LWSGGFGDRSAAIPILLQHLPGRVRTCAVA
jgi:hypothetical protein